MVVGVLGKDAAGVTAAGAVVNAVAGETFTDSLRSWGCASG